MDICESCSRLNVNIFERISTRRYSHSSSLNNIVRKFWLLRTRSKWSLYWAALAISTSRKKVQSFSKFLWKYSFSRDQISNRVCMGIEDSKYYKIYLGKVIFWPLSIKTVEENCNNAKLFILRDSLYDRRESFTMRKSASKAFIQACLLPKFETIMLVSIDNVCFRMLSPGGQGLLSLALFSSSTDSSRKVKSNSVFN